MTVLIDPLAPLQKPLVPINLTILTTDNSYNNKQILVMEKTILGNLEWQYMFLVLFITASMSDPKRLILFFIGTVSSQDSVGRIITVTAAV
ncbi:hypothetical protein HID58_089826 [Brassica napus]|uniref:Uncharacterized protein n=1 Tax=Brassica napus TaxID=3708 RepID=A0ABQ7Y058_BRANA|nr:hypothetical protein HID58_089826 [Brassica napus]